MKVLVKGKWVCRGVRRIIGASHVGRRLPLLRRAQKQLTASELVNVIATYSCHHRLCSNWTIEDEIFCLSIGNTDKPYFRG